MTRRAMICGAGLLGIGTAVFLWGISTGTAVIDVWQWAQLPALDQAIVLKLRLPRLLNAFFVGACLALAGVLFQGILQNSLADPYILGVSSGAGLGAAATFCLPGSSGHPFWISAGALAGALLAMLLVWRLVGVTGRYRPLHFVLMGIIVNAWLSAVMLFILFFSGDQMKDIVYWLFGYLGRPLGEWAWWAYGASVVLLAVAMRDAHALNIARLGDEQAQALGVRLAAVRIRLFLISSCLTGLAVANAGIIGFVGLVIPHVLRLAAGQDFRVLLPLSFVGGGVFLMAMDTLTRSVLGPYELPVGILAAFVGGPFFVVIFFKLLRERRSE